MLKDYLLDVMQQHEHGLYMCELPTGNGKTYDSARAMKEYTDSIGNDTKIIYLTTLNKNLPEDALRAAYGSEELYKRNVLRLRSNFDEVVDKILEIEVPEEMKTDAYLKLCKDVSLYRNAVEKRYADKEYIKELADRITEGDRQLRYEITKRLKNRFQTKTQRKNAIRTDAKYKWIGKLYPAVFTDDYKIILMSVSKFMKRNSILIDSSYEFLNSDLIENAVIVIDEFDATKDTIQSELIDKSLAMQEDYIQLFRQIYRTLNPNDFSSSMRQAMDEVEKSGNRNTFTTLMDEARKIAENYHVRLSIKTKEDLVDQRQIFLFNDGSFHTVLKEGAQYIRSSLNKEDNRIDVFFEGKDDFFKNRNKEKDIVLYSLLREINVFLLHFRLFSIEWARNYMEIINSSRSGIMDTMNLENAISTILKRLELTNKQRDLLMGETCQMIRNNRELILEDRSFYQVGMEYYEFEDNDSHHDNTNLKFVKVYDTPEKIMLYLAGKATVFGISATAEVDTVVGNYDLRYLKEQLKERFRKTPGYLKDKTRNALEKRWSAYADGEINVHGEVISNNIQGFNAEDYCKTFMDAEFARYASNIITNITGNEYQIIRYCNVLQSMLVKSTDAKGNEQRTIEFVPIYKKDYIERSKENALEYLREIMKERKLSKPVILINKIKIDTLFKVDGFYMWLSGRTGNRLIFKGANELILSDEETKILKKVIKFTKRKMENKNVELTAFDGINEVELTHLYDVFVSKLQNTIYKIRLGLQASTLIDNKGKFENLNLEDKCTVLSEILHLFQCQSAAANLKLIGGPASAGILVMNNNIMKCKQISIINQSVTGIYKKEIDLLKL